MLCDDFDVLWFDCDGVLWVGDVPIPGAVDTLRTLTAAGKRCFFVTNNSQYSEAEFATKFERLGFGEFVGPGALWTSVGACEHYLRQLEPANGRRGAFVVGSEGLKDAVSTAGYTLVRRDGPANAEERCYSPEEMGHVEVDSSVSVVVVGFDKMLSYFHIAFAVRCLLENEACQLIVTNRDFQFPMKGKRLPGTGALVAAICTGARREPDVVAAKPSPFMLQSIISAAGVAPHRTLMIGDMWSDIAFGHRAGGRSALVLSGVGTLEDADTWTGDSRPDAVLADVRGLLDPRHVVRPFSASTCSDASLATGSASLGNGSGITNGAGYLASTLRELQRRGRSRNTSNVRIGAGLVLAATASVAAFISSQRRGPARP